MANNVFANGREISCKAGDGKTICEFPDVCFTPPENPATPPGVPIPYPNTAFSKDTSSGSKTVKISSKEVMLKNKSFFKTSTGDEAGCTAKKGVITSKIKGKAYFISWSMDVKIEGENVVRHLDMTTNNHASPVANGAAPMVHTDEIAESSEDCPHPNIKREPEKDEHEINQQERIAQRKRALAKEEKKIDRVVGKAASTADPVKASELFDAALELDASLKGERFEQKVADDTKAKEVAVKLICRDCGLIIAEFDVVTQDGTVKECKASWNQVNENQFLREQALAQRPDVFGPGTVVHIAIPKGERGRLDRKFTNKANAAGKIQEH